MQEHGAVFHIPADIFVHRIVRILRYKIVGIESFIVRPHSYVRRNRFPLRHALIFDFVHLVFERLVIVGGDGSIQECDVVAENNVFAVRAI